jgi:hypothetical protein
MTNVSAFIKFFASTLLVAALIAALVRSNAETSSVGLKGSRKLQFNNANLFNNNGNTIFSPANIAVNSAIATSNSLTGKINNPVFGVTPAQNAVNGALTSSLALTGKINGKVFGVTPAQNAVNGAVGTSLALTGNLFGRFGGP